MSVIYCQATQEYVDTDLVLPDEHAFEFHDSAEECCGGGKHGFITGDCRKCGIPQWQLVEYLAELEEA